ncbi:right-handed parallel beta-helix repeat-containing protein [Acidisoma sp. 7E03]
MPTIDQLQAAIASSDTDELMATQSGSSRKVTRAQLLAGLQPAIVVPPGALLGNSGSSSSGPLAITVGSNLTLTNGVLSAPAPFVISNLPSGSTPAATDLVPLSQNGTAGSVSYGTFLSGLTTLASFDASPLQAIATGGSTRRSLGALLGDAVTLEDFGAAGDGTTNDSAAFTAAIASLRPIRLGPKTYVINGPLALSHASALTLIGVPGQTVVRRLTQGSGSSWITLTAPAIHMEGIIFDANSSITTATTAVTIAASCLRSTTDRCAFANAVTGTGLLYVHSDPVLARHTVSCSEAYGNKTGISCQAADGLTVSACHVHDNSGTGISVDYVNTAHTVKSRLSTITGNQCWNNYIGIAVGDYAAAYASPPTITNQTADGMLSVVCGNICHDNGEYGIVAQGYNLLVQGNLVYNNGGTNPDNGGILANCWASAIVGNVVSNHLGFGIDAGAANFVLISDNLVTTSRIGINAGGAQEPRVTGNSIIAASYYGIVIYNNETDAGGNVIGVPSVGCSITENVIDIPAGGGGILLIDGPQQVQVARNNFLTTSGADIGLFLLPLTDSVTIADNLVNGAPSMHYADAAVTTAGVYAGLNTLLYPDCVDAISVATAGTAIQSIRSLNADNYAPYVTFLKLTAGGSGYTSAPTVTISGGGGSGATAIAYVYNGAVIGFRMQTLGSGYTSVPSVSFSGGGGSGAAATAVVGIPVPTGRRLRVFSSVAVQWASTGSKPSQTTPSGTSITTPANSEITWLGIQGSWYASGFQQTDYLSPQSDGSVTLRSIAGDVRLRPTGSGAVRWQSDSQSTGCTTSIGSGAPTGVVSAPPGSDYRNLTGTAGSIFWIKQSGTNAQGWVAIA